MFNEEFLMTTKVWKMGIGVDQLIADTVDLSDQEFGKYVKMLCYAWKNQSKLDASRPNYLERIDKISDTDIEATKYLLERYFIYDQKGKFFYSTAQKEEWDRVLKISTANTKSANERWDANAMQTQCKRNTSNSNSKSNSKSNKYINIFNEFWINIENKIGKGQAEKTFIKLINDFAVENISPKQLSDLYNKHCKEQSDIKFAKHPATWLNAKGYLDKPMETVIKDDFGVQKRDAFRNLSLWKKGIKTGKDFDGDIILQYQKGNITKEMMDRMGINVNG